MRNAFLIAAREYLENLKTKGFWIGIFLFPVMLIIMIQVPIFLEKRGTPTRWFVLVDQSGQFDGAIMANLETTHQRRVMSELLTYARKFARLDRGTATNSAVGVEDAAPPAEWDTLVRELAGSSAEAVENFTKRGGLADYRNRLKPFLDPIAPPFEEPARRYNRATLPNELAGQRDLASLSEALRPYLQGTKLNTDGQEVELFATVLIPANARELVVRPNSGSRRGAANGGIAYWSGNLADTGLREEVEEAINQEVRRLEYVSLGINLANVAQVEKTYLPFTALNPKKAKGAERVSQIDVMRQWAPTAFVYLLWVALFSINQMLLTNMIEEKSNRIIEVLLSSVTPGELMMGKLGGIAAVGLTIVGTWCASLVGLLISSDTQIARQAFEVVSSSPLLPAFLTYFFFGYLLYGGLFLTIGSLCNTLKEAQNYMAAIMMIMMVPLLTMTFIPKDPNGTLATVLSWIPLYTPFVMMNRITADPPWFDLIGTMALMILFTAAVLWSSGKIFRRAILRTGQAPKVIEWIRWLAAGEAQRKKS